MTSGCKVEEGGQDPDEGAVNVYYFNQIHS